MYTQVHRYILYICIHTDRVVLRRIVVFIKITVGSASNNDSLVTDETTTLLSPGPRRPSYTYILYRYIIIIVSYRVRRVERMVVIYYVLL